MRLQPRGCEIPASEGRRQANHPHFQLGNKGFLCTRGMAVCLLPGTEVSFAEEVRQWAIAPWSSNVISYRTAIFRQVNKDKAYTHHDALEFPDGKIVLSDNP